VVLHLYKECLTSWAGSREIEGKKGLLRHDTFLPAAFVFHVEPSVERVLHGTQNGSTWNLKGFFKGFSYGDCKKKNPFRF
jgi:hypothetical protein